MTRPAIHILRLLRWGRVLARHGALRIVEDGRDTPPQVRRLCRIARIGTIQPRVPDYAGAFQAIGPAAIKLGQTLATRPDLVGEEAARNLLSLQDSLPPVDFALIRQQIEGSFGRPLTELFVSIEETPVGAASIAQVHRAVTTEGRTVAVKVLRPGIRERFTRDIETYEWAAAHLEALGGEVGRLRPRAVIANLRRWSMRELDLRREAASASELAEAMKGYAGYRVPGIDWDRTSGRVLTIEWIDGVKVSDLASLQAAGHDLPELARRLVLAFLTQAISAGFFHADMHQGNLFIEADGTIAAIDFGIMGRIDRRARQWLAEILYGLTTGNYRRVAEIHFEAQYVPAHHSVEEFATALRAVGEPMRGKPVSELSVGDMLDGLFAITRDFDMQTQPHLLLLQKTMVMVEGLATSLWPGINMWDVSGPFVKGWIRDELGPEAAIADKLRSDAQTLLRLPDLIRRIEDHYPPKGGAPDQPPLPEVELMWQRRRDGNRWLGHVLAALAGGRSYGTDAHGDHRIAAPPDWDRFAHWRAVPARLVLAAVAVLLIAAALVPIAAGPSKVKTRGFVENIAAGSDVSRRRDDDLALYDIAIERIERGENYYDFILEEHRKAEYPVRPGLAVRLPTLAYIDAWLGPRGQLAAALVLLAAVLIAWWRRLGGEPGVYVGRRRVMAFALIFLGASLGLNRYFFTLHELWAGMLLALAFGLHRPRRWIASLIVAALALVIRETALPFVLLMAAMAFWRRDWREGAAWSALALAFLALLAIHLHIVAQQVLPTDREGASWLALRGLSGWLSNVALSSNLRYLPHWLAGPLIVLMTLGWAGWRSPAGVFGTFLYLGYALAFMIAGRPDNFYWGAMVAPAMFAGLAFAPMALRSLIASATAK